MKYLFNDICDFTPLFNINYSVKKDIVCCSFFKMLNKGYKDFDIYIKGIYNLYYFIEKLNKKGNRYHLRIFIDNSIHNDPIIMDKLKKLNKLELVLYSCPNYFESNSNHHIGLFGTMVRFFPMFNFPNNDARYVLISDIDDIVFKSLDIALKEMKNKNQIDKISFLKLGNLGKNIRFNYPSLYKDVITIYSIAQSIASLKRLDKQILVDFIKDVKLTKKYYSYYYEIQKNNIDDDLNQKYKNMNSFIYGVDEYFINKILTEYIIDNKIPFAINFFWSINSPLYYILFIDKYLDDDKKIVLNELLDNILDECKLNKNNLKTLKEKYDIIDNIIYKSSDKKLAYQINKIIYKIFLLNKSKSKLKFLFTDDFYKILLNKKYYMRYQFDIIKYYFCDYKDIYMDSKQFNIEDKSFFDKLK